MKKKAWEKKIVQSKTDSKIIWNTIKEILGKTKKKDEQVYLFRKDKTRHRAEEDWGYFMEEWKTEIYQKIPRMDLEFWYGNRENIGMKEEMMRKEIENRNRGEGRMMERPVLTEKDLLRIVNKQKSGKAVGVDGVKAE